MPRIAVTDAEQPELSCVLVTYGTGPIVLDAIGALARTLDRADVAYEIVVVDNEHRWARDRTRRLLRLATSGVRLVVPGRNLGFAGGNNAGVELARGEVLALVNPDVAVTDGWYEALRAELTHATIAAPVFLDADGSVQETGHLIADDGSTWPLADPVAPGELHRPTYVSAACWLIRRADFERLGGFDTGYHPAYYEDADFALRAARDGNGTVVVGSATVRHFRRGSTADGREVDLLTQRARFRRAWPDVVAAAPPPPT
ncbi:MAG: glycosyltransferase family 2 protein [Ilumatobacter sp.]|nr:glycosyltransferase family 2 protein [Ilumatobacter sp.]